MDKCERLMVELRSACVKEQVVRSYHVIYAQEVVSDLAAAIARIAALEAQLAERGKANREEVAKHVYDAMSWAAVCGPDAATGTVPRWVDGGNSLGQDEARKAADAILSTLEATPPAPKVTEGHPMQPVVVSDGGVHRFKSNTCVEALLSHGQKTGFGLNELACQNHPVEDRMQLAQLIGYSVSGYGDLSYVTDESYDAASRLSEALTAAQEAGKP